MSFTYIDQLPTPDEIKQEFPLSETARAAKIARDKEISAVIRGESDKFLVIIGPCSADNETSVMDYIKRLVPIQAETKDRLIIIPRI